MLNLVSFTTRTTLDWHWLASLTRIAQLNSQSSSIGFNRKPAVVLAGRRSECVPIPLNGFNEINQVAQLLQLNWRAKFIHRHRAGDNVVNLTLAHFRFGQSRQAASANRAILCQQIARLPLGDYNAPQACPLSLSFVARSSVCLICHLQLNTNMARVSRPTGRPAACESPLDSLKSLCVAERTTLLIET